MTNVSPGRQRTTVIGDTEFSGILETAAAIPDEFYRLRALALIALVRLTGKRRVELSRLELAADFEQGETSLNVTFSVAKKRKKNRMLIRSIKELPLANPLTQLIVRYLEYLRGLEPEPRFFLPHTQPLFGSGRYLIDPDRGIQPRQVYNLVVGVGPDTWPHLYRESAASDIVKGDDSLIAVFKIMRRLDLQKYETGFNYLRRFAADKIESQESLIKQTSAPA